ncbi:MAG: sulfurtransferase TusA family protein [Rhodospirillales bacterium]|nr:sulfurtransferase TusA family protein [Rhodospirillales bacterium]
MEKCNILDVQGLACPLPVLRANKVLRGMAGGDELTVLATDAAAPRDFDSYCKSTGHQLLESSEEEGVFRIVIRKKG